MKAKEKTLAYFRCDKGQYRVLLRVSSRKKEYVYLCAPVDSDFTFEVPCSSVRELIEELIGYGEDADDLVINRELILKLRDTDPAFDAALAAWETLRYDDLESGNAYLATQAAEALRKAKIVEAMELLREALASRTTDVLRKAVQDALSALRS